MRRKFAGRKKREKGLFSRTLIIFCIALIIALCFLRIKVEHTRTGYEISKNREVERALLKETVMLHHEILKLKSLEHLKPVADKKGFRFASYKDVVFVEEVIVAQEEQDEGF
ncbi:MAG: hypothetical protein OXI02_05230 [Candidatus Dadabacteria bacterium]|nr:hypothetical protein [Candidatus Dadabacteria bacterium]MDE0477450.1 hypothetical protein [Candidatus Dadabacteria bacterium]MXZ49131.1 hypothetical protein [Candidatus Dadabacteria bacterium]MYB26440.1 hypothetical protein [Candidatus Dadabacteria bacterium]MYE60621.1 hypothetical protein [Candidatus Dadabacteria bacterium]